MNYQGRILEGGAPVNGQRNIRFRIYNALTGGTLLFSEIRNGVTVSDGLFATTFGQNQSGGSAASLTAALATAGENAHLEVRVGSTTLAPREKISAAPFALRAASVDAPLGLGETDPLTTLHITKDELNLTSDALQLDDIIVEDGDAILGLYSTPVGAFGSGVVLKEIQGAGDPSPGALKSTWAMVRETEGNGNGLQFTYGTDPRYNANPLALRLGTGGSITIPPSTRYYSIGPRDFVSDTGAELSGSGWSATGGPFFLVGPIHLPHGATITELRGYGRDTTNQDGLQFRIHRNMLSDGSSDLLAIATTTAAGVPGQTTAIDTTIEFAIIDNTRYSYFVFCGGNFGVTPADGLVVHGMRIEYEVTTPLP